MPHRLSMRTIYLDALVLHSTLSRMVLLNFGNIVCVKGNFIEYQHKFNKEKTVHVVHDNFFLFRMLRPVAERSAGFYT